MPQLSKISAQRPDQDPFAHLIDAVATRKHLLLDYLLQDRFVKRFQPAHIRDAVFSYVKSGGKSLRPAVAMLACGALGGDESAVLPVAAAIEIYHTWTLVHDDVIDRDATRRGGPTVHTEYADRARRDFGWTGADAEHYGRTIALLTGDVQQAWSWSLLFEAHLERDVSADVVLALAQELASHVTPLLVEGETLDVQFAGKRNQIGEADVVDMLWKKTGVLYEFAGRAGAAIALNTADSGVPAVRSLAQFCSLCGTAFQIQDDILGVVGDTRQLGKPVGSDIREGKSTLLTLKALQLADEGQRARIQSTLGNAEANNAAISDVAQLLRDLGVIKYAQDISHKYVDKALEHLQPLPDSEYKVLLQSWANYLIQRDL